MRKLLQIILIGILILGCNSKKKAKIKTELESVKTVTESAKNDLKDSLDNKPIEKDWKKLNLVRIEKENIIVSKSQIDTSDVYNADNQSVIFISPNEKEINKMKKKLGEDDFYTVVDDINYYSSQAYDFLESRTMKSYHTDKRFVRFTMKNGDTVYVDTEKVESKWTVILCDGYDKPYSSDIIDLHLNFEELDE
ncbi:hypothetical protein MHTCC0001_35220 [Flavobacteriaceae bacterium MHTCC 0001]